MHPDKKLPTFLGTKAAVENYCAKCGTSKTAGCWRRGWTVDNASVNLCNRCGLQYKNGKLESSFTNDVKQQEHSSPFSSNASYMDDAHLAASGPYIGYSISREADVGVAKKVLFYVHDSEGNEKLALIGYDSRGTGHFSYESVDGFHPSLKCRNRTHVFSWLEEMGAVRLLERSAEKTKRSNKIPQRPTLDKEYCEYREEVAKEGEADVEQFYLVDAAGNELLTVHGSIHGDSFLYRCVLKNYDLTFEDRQEVIGWLNWLIGKAEAPPYRFQRKEPRKPVRTRDSFTSSLAETGSAKRRLSGIQLEDMQAVFEDADLLRWVLRKPTTEEIETFHQWSDRLKPAAERVRLQQPDNETEDPQEVLDLLRKIREKETCLKLLEMSSLGRPVSGLRNHQNEEISELAKEITKSWNDWTTRALTKASAAKKKNAWMM